jgi:hypothetical protein
VIYTPAAMAVDGGAFEQTSARDSLMQGMATRKE